MAVTRTCDGCNQPLPRFYLIIKPGSLTAGRDGEVTFLDGSWNGGEFCSRPCALAAVGALGWPEEREPTG